ncbi:MAG: sodium:solute symporter [Acidobacteria bacterium RIFCSPLOWO2_02_FULL_67_21]|nr:MAG: sodium:solute symporter [Acidobacteria bacterium RIFCSPLOWO2_02_FULL_67_21]
MHPIDWSIIAIYLVWIVWDGLRLTTRSHEIEGYFLAGRSLPWWAVGLSVMATQLSAITMIGTTGQGYADGMRFLQFYYALPLAMIILSVTLVPFFHKARVYTAYEYLERRFDAKTRAFTSLLFLLSRSMSLGVVISAPAVVLAVVLGISVTSTVLLIALPTAVYTMFGGVQAVTWTDVKQMVLIVGGLTASIVVLVLALPPEVGIVQALHIAGATGRLQTFDFTFDLSNQYTFWSGTIAALFLFCSYFGTDQSQVQRYLTARSVDEARGSLLMSGYWKIPLQALVLLVGVFVFLFYLFTPGPMLFNPVHERAVREGSRAGEYAALEERFEAAAAARREAALALAEAQGADDALRLDAAGQAFKAREVDVRAIRSEALTLVRDATGDRTYNDVNYVFPTFIMRHMPIGLVGLLFAAIFAAAMSTISAELASLSAATVIDFYRRFMRRDADDRHYLRVSKLATGFWGLFASAVAVWAAELGSLIEVVNRFGSFFYGSILGVFMLAVGVPRATGTGAFIGLIAGMASVAWVARFTDIAFLWHNVIGAVAVVIVGSAVSAVRVR